MLFEVRQGDGPMNIETDRTHIVIEYDISGRLIINTSAPDSDGRVGVIYELEARNDGEDVDKGTDDNG